MITLSEVEPNVSANLTFDISSELVSGRAVVGDVCVDLSCVGLSAFLASSRRRSSFCLSVSFSESRWSLGEISSIGLTDIDGVSRH